MPQPAAWTADRLTLVLVAGTGQKQSQPAPLGPGRTRPAQERSWDCQVRPPSAVPSSTAWPARSVPTTQPRVALAKLTDSGFDRVVPGMPGSRRSWLPWLISTTPVTSAGGVGLSRNARWELITENGPESVPGPIGKGSTLPSVPGSPSAPRQLAPPSPLAYSA